MSTPLRGAITALITPFTERGELDETALAAFVGDGFRLKRTPLCPTRLQTSHQ